jgi:hypothetical protein
MLLTISVMSIKHRKIFAYHLANLSFKFAFHNDGESRWNING